VSVSATHKTTERLLLFIFRHPKFGRGENGLIKDGPVHWTVMQEVENLLSVIRTEAVLVVHVCARPESIELGFTMSRVETLVVAKRKEIKGIQELLVVRYMGSFMGLRFSAPSPPEVNRNLDVFITRSAACRVDLAVFVPT